MPHMVACKRPTVVARLLVGVVLIALVTSALLIYIGTAHAANAEPTCQRGRYLLMAKYAKCHQQALGRHFGGVKCFSAEGFEDKISKCRVRYTTAWEKLRAVTSGTGATCDNARFQDNGNGTLTDRLTGLQWEQKTNDASVHDAGNVYTWSTGYTAADGTAYTSFLATLNSTGCFANHCDWRLPVLSELLTILKDPYPCTTSPCIDQAVFGPTPAIGNWAATTYVGNQWEAWGVSFQTGNVFNLSKTAAFYYVRAVRGGL
jgi:Protein of unknown function (DUF1566)